MPTGDPYCITHGWNYCVCREAHRNGYWVGDQQPNYDLQYRPDPEAWKQYYYQTEDAVPYQDSTEIIISTEHHGYAEHTRWSRMLMCIEEAWEWLPGIPYTYTVALTGSTATHSEVRINWDDTNYSSNQIIWSST